MEKNEKSAEDLALNANLELIENFTIALNNYKNTKPDLYDKIIDIKCEYNANEVISSVVSSVKMMQNSDRIKNFKDSNVLHKFKKTSTFMPVNAIPVDIAPTTAVQHHQCGPETQNMIEVAEVLTQMISYKGVTQEFDMPFHNRENDMENSTFPHVITINTENDKNSYDCDFKALKELQPDISPKEENSNTSKKSALTCDLPTQSCGSKSYSDSEENKKSKCSSPIISSNRRLKINSDVTMFSEQNFDKSQRQTECKSPILSKNLLLPVSDHIILDAAENVHNDNTQFSQIFQSKVHYIRNEDDGSLNLPLSIAYNLKSFEEFEKVAMPVIFSHKNQNMDKIESEIKYEMNKKLSRREQSGETHDVDLDITDICSIEYFCDSDMEGSNENERKDFAELKLTINEHESAKKGKEKFEITFVGEITLSSDEESDYIKNDTPEQVSRSDDSTTKAEIDIFDDDVFDLKETSPTKIIQNKNITTVTEKYSQKSEKALSKTKSTFQHFDKALTLHESDSPDILQSYLMEITDNLRLNVLSQDKKRNTNKIISRSKPMLNAKYSTISQSKVETDDSSLKTFIPEKPKIVDCIITNNKMIKVVNKPSNKVKDIQDCSEVKTNNKITEEIIANIKIPENTITTVQNDIKNNLLQKTKMPDTVEENIFSAMMPQKTNKKIDQSEALDFSRLIEDEYNLHERRRAFVRLRTGNKKIKQMSKLTDCVLKNLKFDKSNLNKNSHTKDGNLRETKDSDRNSNKKIEIQKKALEKSKHLCKDLKLKQVKSNSFLIDDMGENSQVPRKNFETLNKIPACVEFQTDSIKNVNITEKVFEENDHLFSDIKQDDSKKKELFQIKERCKMPNVSPAFIGFSTANNKKVEISTKAIEKTKHMFEDLDPTLTTVNFVKAELDEEPKFIGFRTVSKKEVQISEEAMEKTKNIFGDLQNNYLTISNDSYKLKNNVPFLGFTTASNKKIEISEKALSKTKRLFDGLEETVPLIDFIESQPDKKQNFIGFSTANNKIIEISKKSLLKTKHLFDGLEETIPLNDFDETELNKKANFIGFNTANNQEVEIAQRPLAKIINKFKDTEKNNLTINEHSHISKSNIPVFGFCTASNKKVIVSEKALATTKELFKDTIGNVGDEVSDLLICSKKTTEDIKINKVVEEKISWENIIDTQIAHNFNETIHSQEFHNKSPEVYKRSASPILSCPRAKRRKIFKTPYTNEETICSKPNITEVKKQIPDIIYRSKPDYKKNKKIFLRDLQNFILDEGEINTDLNLFQLENYTDFEFDETRNSLTSSKMSYDDLKDTFLGLPAINKKLVPEGWIENHVKLISWKLISYELKFPHVMNNVFNTENMLDQLKYRYDREIYNCERPALRKILEKDEIASRTMILCVMKIHTIEEDVTRDQDMNIELEMTDGWYVLRVTIDNLLKKMVSIDRIKVGTKLMIQGAELINCDQGMAPWEDTTQVRLKIFGNSTRRARWDSRLGFHGDAAILVPMSSIKVEGGKVSKIRVFVARVYPLLYVEKFENGSTVTRSERLEHLYEGKYETEKQMALEKIYDEVEKEFSDKDSADSEESVYGSGGCKRKMESGSQIAKYMKKCKDPTEFRANLTGSQNVLLKQDTVENEEKRLKKLKEKINEKIAKCNLKMRRNVMPVLKVRIVDLKVKNGKVETTKGLLSIWNANENVLEILKEGIWVDMSNVTPTGIRGEEIKISANRHTVFNKIHVKENSLLKSHIETLSRECSSAEQIVKYPFKRPEFNEIDTVGLIFAIEPSTAEFKRQKNSNLQNIFLMDAKKNFICINFWGGIEKFGYENLIDTGQIINCTNLQKRIGNTHKNIPQFRATEFSCFTKIPKNSNSRLLYAELSQFLNTISIKKFCDECIYLKNVAPIKNNNENVSPYQFSNNNNNCNKNKFIDSSLLKANGKLEYDLSGIDFESTFRQPDMAELSPSERLRKKRLNEKLQKLQMYQEPPKLSPIHIINKSVRANSSFKSPLSNNVADKCTPIASPISTNSRMRETNIRINDENCMQRNRTLEINKSVINKKMINPIKLDFSADAASGNTSKDPVLEDFEESPPLSLDSVTF